MPTIDPIKFCKVFWPDLELYDRQREILYSVRDNDETVVVAGNELGKDFVAALCALWFFVSRRPCKVVTTSVQGGQLNDVLWAEIRRFVDTAKMPLPIKYNHLMVRQVRSDGSLEPRSSLTGQVVAQGEALLGRHLERGPNGEPRTLAIFDEASGIKDLTYNSSDTWAHRKLIVGNPYPCENFFRAGVRAGDLKAPTNGHMYRKVIKIKATDSPNVRLALKQQSQGGTPTNRVLVPGVVDYPTYLKRRATWDSVRQCIGLDAEFYEGAESLLFPPAWLNRAELRAAELAGSRRRASTIGVDPAEGGDSTVWAVVDELGLIELLSMKTPDTTVVVSQTLVLMRKHQVEAEHVLFDQGGGGKEHADRLRSQGQPVRTVAFGGSATLPLQRGRKTFGQRVGAEESRYAYKNRRSEMYGRLRLRLDPAAGPGFGLPGQYVELRRELAPIPLWYDSEGRLELPPKNVREAGHKRTTLVELIGHSPDNADALALAVYGLDRQGARRQAGAIVF